MPREPYQRCSLAIFEAWLKKRILAEPLIDTRYGHIFESFKEDKGFVKAEIANVEKNENYIVRSRFLVGCDGAGSRVRRNLNVELVGGLPYVPRLPWSDCELSDEANCDVL